MELIALKKFKLKTSRGTLFLVPGSTFEPVDPEVYIVKGLARRINDEDFKHEFRKVSIYLQNNFSEKNMQRLKELVLILDDCWEKQSLFRFRSTVNLILGIPPLIPEGQVCYLAEEALNLRGASPEDIRQIHLIKKELGGVLISSKEKGES